MRVHVQKDWFKNLGWSKTQWETFYKSVTCLCAYISVHSFRLDVWSWFFFLGPNKKKNKECRIENLLPLSLSFYSLLFSCMRLFTHEAVQISNLNEIWKHQRNFLGNDVASKIQLSPSTATVPVYCKCFFCECMGFFWRYFCHMKSFYVCFMAEEPFWILKAKYYVESWMNVSFWSLYKISFGFEIKHADSKKKNNTSTRTWQPVEMKKCIVACIRFWIDDIFSFYHKNCVLQNSQCTANRLHESLLLLSVFVYTNTPEKSTMSLLFDSVGSQSNNITGIFVVVAADLLTPVKIYTPPHCITCNVILISLSKFQPQHSKWMPSVPNNEHIQFTWSQFSFVLFFSCLQWDQIYCGYKMNFSICRAHSLTDTARLCHLFKYVGCLCGVYVTGFGVLAQYCFNLIRTPKNFQCLSFFFSSLLFNSYYVVNLAFTFHSK